MNKKEYIKKSREKVLTALQEQSPMSLKEAMEQHRWAMGEKTPKSNKPKK